MSLISYPVCTSTKDLSFISLSLYNETFRNLGKARTFSFNFWIFGVIFKKMWLWFKSWKPQKKLVLISSQFH